jgi:hypothetical protein
MGVGAAMNNDQQEAKNSTRLGMSRWKRWLSAGVVVAFILLGLGVWAQLGRSSHAMRWYTGPLHRDEFDQAKHFFREIVPNRQKIAFHNLFVNEAFGISNVCGELNVQRKDGSYTGFQMFYVEIIGGSPEKVAVVPPDLDTAKFSEWKTHCGEGRDTAKLFSERLSRAVFAAKASLDGWSAEQQENAPIKK